MKDLLKIELEFDKKIGYFVSSRIIADGLGKRHADVLESLDKIKSDSRTEISALLIESSYKASNGKMNREYKLTKDGFTLYMFHIQGFTEFKMAYIKRFNEMENLIKETHTKIKEITNKEKPDWVYERIAEDVEKAKKLENQIEKLLNKLYPLYDEIAGVANLKKRTIGYNFFSFKSDDEEKKCKTEIEIEKKHLKEIEKLGLNKDEVVEKAIEKLPSLELEKSNDGSIEIKVK